MNAGHDNIETIKNSLATQLGDLRFGTVLADPPWRFANRTGKVAPEHGRLNRYATMSVDEIAELPIMDHMADVAHCYLWVPNALLPDGLRVMEAWGFAYKSNLIWHKVRKDGGSDGRGVGFYFRNVTEIILFGVRGKNARTLGPGAKAGQLDRQSKTRALAQTGRTVRCHRKLQLGAVPRIVRQGITRELDGLGRSGAGRVSARLGHICLQLGCCRHKP